MLVSFSCRSCCLHSICAFHLAISLQLGDRWRDQSLIYFQDHFLCISLLRGTSFFKLGFSNMHFHLSWNNNYAMLIFSVCLTHFFPYTDGRNVLLYKFISIVKVICGIIVCVTLLNILSNLYLPDYFCFLNLQDTSIPRIRRCCFECCLFLLYEHVIVGCQKIK